jgi:hypothetical protein
VHIEIKTDFKEAYALLKVLPATLRDKVMAGSLNRTIEQGRTQAVRSITSEYNMKASYARARLSISYARRASGAFSMTARLSGGNGRKRAANVISFDARQVAGGVSVKIKKSAGRKIIKGAFIANKGRTVFERASGTTMASRGKYSGTKHGEAIKAVQTVGIPQMFTSRKVNKAIEQSLLSNFPKVFRQQLSFHMGKYFK